MKGEPKQELGFNTYIVQIDLHLAPNLSTIRPLFNSLSYRRSLKIAEGSTMSPAGRLPIRKEK
tara:strand:+ start:170784 stop:170972 length:189 start_codon:yes stop_codon:yes gene_type:complete